MASENTTMTSTPAPVTAPVVPPTTPAPASTPAVPPTSTIRLKAKLDDKGITEIKALITHPMETGLRLDHATGAPVATHFIKEVICEHNGKTILSTVWGSGISRDPYLSFKFKGGKVGDKVKLSWIDNQDEKDSVEAVIEAEKAE